MVRLAYANRDPYAANSYQTKEEDMHLPRQFCIGLTAILILAFGSTAMALDAKQEPKVDNFVFFFDASGSMRDNYMGQGTFTNVTGTTGTTGEVEDFKFGFAKRAMQSMNQMIPELGYQAGLYSAVTGYQSYLDMGPYDTAAMDQAIEKTEVAPRMYGYNTPLADGISKLEPVLKDLSGETAVILFTDGGENLGGAPAQVIDSLGTQYNTCFHIVSYAQSTEEKETIDAMAKVQDCTVLVTGADMEDKAKMKGFVEQVFYTTIKDSDGDGVPDCRDECPDTPAGVEVDEVGCPVDSDGDGVPDYRDKCPNTEAGVEVDDEGCAYPVTKRIKVYFDFDKAAIKDEYHGVLMKIADYLKRNKKTEMVIEGHTDSVGSAEYNMRLSEKRAENVKAYLVDNFGIDADRLEAKGYGETRPIADNETKQGQQKNRRVVGIVSK